jgi:hypothetical protein
MQKHLLYFDWSFLVLWGYQKPVERRGLLLITIFPVIVGLMASSLYQLVSGAFELDRVIPYLLLGVALIFLFGFSDYEARLIRK